MRVAIVGYRNFTNYKLFKEKCDEILNLHKVSCIVSGGCRGTDLLAERYAKENKISTKIFYANWKLFGARAGPLRNKEIVEYSDMMIAFLSSKSRGTLSAISLAKNKKIKVHVVNIDKSPKNILEFFAKKS